MLTPTPAQLAWLEGRFEAVPLTPEAGARRYFRSPDPEVRGWLRVTSPDPPPYPTTRFLSACGVRVPKVGPAIAGVYLVEDLGDRHLAQAPSLVAYEEVLAAHRQWLRTSLPARHPNRRLALDEGLFRRELALFREAFLERRFRPASWQPACAWIAERAAAGPQALQHRDLHSRNVLLPVHGSVAMIDHQDLRRGPFLYDLASLATDAYVDLPPSIAARIREEVRALGALHGLAPPASERQLLWTALQRVLKALGTFGQMQAAGREDYAEPEVCARRHAAALIARLRTVEPESAAILATLPDLTPERASTPPPVPDAPAPPRARPMA